MVSSLVLLCCNLYSIWFHVILTVLCAVCCDNARIARAVARRA